jgi:hypothetical protein
VKNKCAGLVRTANDEYLDKQAVILDSPSPSIKNWWKLFKNLSGIPSTNSVYPPVLLGIAISTALKIVFVTLSTAVSKSVLSIR